MPILLAALALIVAVVHAVIYRRGDRRRDLRRCTKCRYDMGQVPGMTCPECGQTAPAEAKFHYTRRKRRFAGLAAFWLLVGVGIFIGGAVRHGGVVSMLPRPVLAWLLDQAVPAPAKAAGADIPGVVAGPRVPLPNQSLWQRMSWQQGYLHAVRDWGALVATDDPVKVFADLPRMQAALVAMEQWRIIKGSTAWVDGWLVMDEIDRQRQRIENHPTRSVTFPVPGAAGGAVTLDRNELLMLAFQPPRNQCEGIGLRGGAYIAAPQTYLEAMANCTTPTAQRYALERLGPEPTGAVDIDALIVNVEKSAAAPEIRDIAGTIRLWRTGYMNRKTKP